MSTFANYKRAPRLTEENQMVTVTFKEITEVVEKETDTTKGFFVKTEEFQDMWVPFFGPDKTKTTSNSRISRMNWESAQMNQETSRLTMQKPDLRLSFQE